MGRRLALLIATYDYQDTGLRRLTAPAHDAEALATVLKDPAIAGFEVTTMVNEPHHRIGEAIGDFYRDRRRDDLTLLYFTGHGLKDDNGLLYLAMTNTRRDSLLFTALSAEQIDQAMEGCVSRQKVLILDCCYSGAFPAGRISKSDTAVHALERFQGRGRTVLTASDATQYSFEGNQAHGQAVQSVFTRYLVQGLRDGSADLDGDGDITLDELYGYVHDRVVDEMPQQRPKKQDNVEGRIVIARNINWSLPAHLRHALGSPIATDRLGAVDGLAHLHRIGNDLVRGHALAGLQGLVDDDSRLVSAGAAERLRALQPISPETPPEKNRPLEQEPGPPEPAPQERAPEPPPPTPAPAPQASRPVQHTEGSPVPSRPLARSAPPTTPSARTPTPSARWASRLIPRTLRGRAITAGLAVLVAAVLAFGPWHLASSFNGSASSPSTGAPKIELDRASAVLTVRSSAHGSVNDLAFSPDGKTLAASSGDQAVHLWDAASHRSLTSITTTSKAVTSVAFSPDGKTLAAGTGNGLGLDAKAQVWKLPAGDSGATMTGHTDTVNSVALSSDGKVLATGSWDGTARLWDAATGKLLTTLIRVQGDWPRCVCTVAFSPDGKTLATGSTDKTVRLWDVAARKLRRTLTGHTYGVNTLAFGPDGRTLASGSIDGTIRLWNVATGNPLGTLQSDTLSSANVTGVAFDPKDGNILASVGDNGENRLLLWNVTTHKAITQFTASERGLSSVAWSPDGRTLATGDADKAEVRLWDVPRVKSAS